MRFSTLRTKPDQISTDLLIVPVMSRELKAGAKGRPAELQRILGAALSKTLRDQGFDGKDGQQLLLRGLPDVKAAAVLLAGWEDVSDEPLFDKAMRYRKLGAVIRRAARDVKARRAAIVPHPLALDDEECGAALIEGLVLAGYRFTRYQKFDAEPGLAEFVVLGGSGFSAAVLQRTSPACTATALARDLINTPARDCSPADLVRVCRDVARRRRLSLRVYDRAVLEKLGAGALLAVGQASARPPALVRLVYKPRKPAKAVALVGKGITFDSGGLSIKPLDGMMTMKCDMSGAAAVIAVMEAIAVLKPKIEVRAYLPLAENMVSGNSVKPGDVVKTLNGKTVEVLNTDAEGRLILADAISLAVREKPDQLIDLATLTGACVVALGDEYAGLFASDDALAEELQQAAAAAGERLWRMPLAPEYKGQLKSSVADLKNIGAGRTGGAITAALFLQEFVGDVPWAHLDIAGPAFTDKDERHLTKGGVGFGVRTLLRWLGGK